MSSDSNQENSQHSTEAGGTEQAGNDKKPLSFKDWKSLKDSQKKCQEKPQNARNKNTNKNANNQSKDNEQTGVNGRNNRSSNSQAGGNFFQGNQQQRMPSGFMPPNNLFGMNPFNNNFNRMNNNFNGNNFGMGGNGNFRPPNGFNNSNGNGFNNFNGNNNSNNNNNNFNRNNNFGGSCNFPKLPAPPKFDLPDNFFSSDGIFRQKDMMQQPLPPSQNPFRNDQKAQELLEEFDRRRYTKDDKKKKKKSNKNAGESNNSGKNNTSKQGANSGIAKEPEVYVPNPKARQDGKPYIPKPKIPEENLEISKEEKKQQWKEYRQAMKPFKNREFYNAKRVVQRLGKLPLNELEERQIIRLANAREIMANHKAHLTEKYANYVKADDSSNELGELYVLKKNPNKDLYFNKGPALQNSGNFGESEPGRKILGGYGGGGGFRGFVSGGMLERPAGSLCVE